MARSEAAIDRWRDPEYRRRRAESHHRGWARIRAGEGFIYVASVGKSWVKIGFSLNPAKRVSEQSVPVQHILLATAPASLADEKQLHRTLRAHLGYGRTGETYPRTILSHPAIPAELRAAA